MKLIHVILAFTLVGTSGLSFANTCHDNSANEGASASVAVQKLTLSVCKDSLWLGEMSTGYLGAVTEDIPEDARLLLEETNAARKSKYKKTSREKKTKLDVVIEKAGIRNLRKTHAGHYIHVDGAWKIKVEEAE